MTPDLMNRIKLSRLDEENLTKTAKVYLNMAQEARDHTNDLLKEAGIVFD